MSRTTKYLDSKCRLNAARAFFQISNVLLFGFADSPQRGAKADTDAILWFFAGIIDTRVVQRELGGHDSELGIAIKPFQSVRRKKLFRIPIANLAGTTHTENTRIESCDARNDRAPLVHAATLFTLASM